MKIRKNFLFSFLIISLSLIPFILRGTEFEVKVIQSSEDLPQEFCRIWKKGDIVLSDGKNLVLIGGVKRPLKTFHKVDALGCILSFIPADKALTSDLGLGAPSIKIKDRTKYPTYSSLKQIKENIPKESVCFEASGMYEDKEGKKADIKTIYTFFYQKGRIDITSTIKNIGKEAFKDLNFSLYFTAFHSYSFSPFDRKKHTDLRYRVYQKQDHYLAWMNMNPYRGEEKLDPGKLAPGELFQVSYILLTDSRSENLLNHIYHILNIEPVETTIQLKDFKGNLMEVVISDAFSPSVYYRSFLENPLLIKVPLPKGTYLVRANFFPAVCEEILTVEKGAENSCTLKDLPYATLKVKVRNSQGEFVPGKVTFIGLDPTKTPYFKPENPVKTENNWEKFKNSCFPQKDGLKVKVPVGVYLVYASRGPQYTLDQKVVEVLKDEDQELTFIIDKVVEMPNFISIDPHMHTQNSDGSVLIPERIKSVVAEGLDAAVATDHDYITDYTPALKKLGLSEYLAVIQGSEVTRGEVIHFNTYPLKYRPEEEHNGAINPVAEEASILFKASRKKNPEAILQVNHPRADNLGYFNNYSLDQESAAYALQTFDTSFDILEVMNGPYFYHSNYVAIEDWFHLLNRGYFFPIVGSSDSHHIDRAEPGYSRTCVYYTGKKGEALNWESLFQSLKKGRSFATNGPLIEFKVNGKYTSGDSFTVKGGKVDVWLKVQSAPWIAVDEVRLIVNGERKIIFPVKIEEKHIQKFTEEISLKLQRDSYIAAEILGKKSLYPVLQRPSSTGELKEAVLPYALTNPVFVDVDGNGTFDPPLPEKIKLTSDIPEEKETVKRY